MGAKKLNRNTFKHVENEILYYHETKKEIMKLKNEIIHSSPSFDEIGGGRSNLPSDPTGRTAVTILSNKRVQHLENVVDAIDSVYNSLPDIKQKLVREYYWKKPRYLTWDGIALELNIGRRTALRWREEIIAEIMYKLGWK